jgi:PilZ domain
MAGIHLTDLQSEKQLAAHIENLNLLGCFVETVTPFPKGTKVRLQISHGGVNFIAIGKVAYSRPNSGMGITFITIEPKKQEVLDLWLADLRK